MDPRIESLVASIHATPMMAVLVITGGGAQALSWVLGVPGASRTVLEAAVPYSRASLAAFLGSEPKRPASPRTAGDMATAAYQRALTLRHSDAQVAGVACTAAIATDRPRRGDHRCFVAASTSEVVTTYALRLVKGLRDRHGEDRIVSLLILRALAEAAGSTFDVPMSLDAGEKVEVTQGSRDPVRRLLAGELRTVSVDPDGRATADSRVRGGVLPGSFDPVHEGHTALATVAERMLETPVTFELSVENVDKPPLGEAEVRKRISHLAAKWPLVLTRAPVFHEKARLFPGCTFVVGSDTAARIVEPKYYGGDRSRMLAALHEIRQAGCRFLVAGRVTSGVFRSLADIDVPAGFDDMFTPIPESEFRSDVLFYGAAPCWTRNPGRSPIGPSALLPHQGRTSDWWARWSRDRLLMAAQPIS